MHLPKLKIYYLVLTERYKIKKMKRSNNIKGGDEKTFIANTIIRFMFQISYR